MLQGNTLEEEEVTTSKIAWTGLIYVENCLIGIKGMKVNSNEVFYFKLEHGMIRDEQRSGVKKQGIFCRSRTM